MKILLIGHACGPDLGSEPGFTWNWAQALSAANQVWVIAHPEHRAATEAYLTRRPNANLRFLWVVPPQRFDPWQPGKSERGIRLHYLLWLKAAYRQAQQLCRGAGIEIVHHVSWGTAGAVPPLWHVPVPVIWGPLGGAQTTPAAFLQYFGRQRWMEAVRTARVHMLRYSGRLRRAARQASVVFATNRETAELLRGAGARQVELLLDGGLPAGFAPGALPHKAPSAGVTVLWAGRLEARKGLPLALHALARQPHVPVRLVVAGSGPQEGTFRALAAELRLGDRVQFLGAVPYREMVTLFRTSSAFLFTSLRDSFGSVVLEAMAQGLPVVTLDHQGVGTFVPADAGIKVPVSTPERTIALLADALENLCASPEQRESMRRAAWNFAKEQTWERRAQAMLAVYESVTERVYRAA